MRIKEVDEMIEEISHVKTPYMMDYLSLEFRIDKGVYSPGEESFMLARNLIDGKYLVRLGDEILDYGTGSGFLSLVAAKKGAIVTATDINPQAVACARNNFNRLSGSLPGLINAPQLGNGFSPIQKDVLFDTILASLPYDCGIPNNWLEHSFYDEDFAMRKELFANAKKHLAKPDGKILFTYSQKAQERNPIENFCKGYYINKIDEVAAKNDVYYLLQIKPL